MPRPHKACVETEKEREFRRLVERCRPQGRWVRRVRPVPCPAVDLAARMYGRLFRPILLIPSWEGLHAIPKRTEDPASDITARSTEEPESA